MNRNLGESYFCSSTKSRLEIPGYQLQALAAHSSVRERKQRVDVEVSPSEGNEVRRDDGRMSQRFDSTVEAGELALEDPVEESEASAGRLNRGKHVEHIEVHQHVHVT